MHVCAHLCTCARLYLSASAFSEQCLPAPLCDCMYGPVPVVQASLCLPLPMCLLLPSISPSVPIFARLWLSVALISTYRACVCMPAFAYVPVFPCLHLPVACLYAPTCTFLSVHASLCRPMPTCLYVRVPAYACTHTCVGELAHAHTQALTCTQTQHARAYANAHGNALAQANAYAHTRASTHTHAQTYADSHADARTRLCSSY